MNDKTRMTLFVKYLLLGLWGLATAATVAHVWNIREDLFFTLTAVVTLAGVIMAIVKRIQ